MNVPRNIIWKHRQKHHPDIPVITRLGHDLKVRVYPNDIIGRAIYLNGMFEVDECRFVMSFLKHSLLIVRARLPRRSRGSIARQRSRTS